MSFITDRLFWGDILQNLRTLGGGAVAGTVGSPVDIAMMNPLAPGYQRMASLLGTAPKSNEKEFGSTDYFGGLLGLDTDSLPFIAGSALLGKDPSKAAKGLLKAAKEGAEELVKAPKKIALSYKRFQGGDKEGIYRGSEAFGGITPAKLGSMRSKYLEKMEEGVPGMYWYDQSSPAIMRLTGSNAADYKKADDLANILAVTSAGTPVAPNLMYAAKGWNQRLVGEPVKTGRFPNDMGEEIERVLGADAGAAGGLKRSPFSAGLSVGWRGPEFANRPVHDIHDVRAWGIKDPKTGQDWKKGVGEAGHRFLDEQGQFVTDKANATRLAGHDDWTPYRAQAAAWVAQKARKEGIPVDEAAKHYGTAIPEYSALVTRSWNPADNSGHLQGLLSMPAEKQQAFNDALEKVVTGAEGQDKVALGLGALSDRTLKNSGLYEGLVEPGFASVIPVGKETGSQMLDPASERVLRTIAASHGLLGVQKQSAYSFLGGTEGVGKAGGAKFLSPDGGPLPVPTLRQMQDDLLARGGDLVTVDPRGGRVLIFNPTADEAAQEAARMARMTGAPLDDARALGEAAKPDAIRERNAVVKGIRDVGSQYGLDVNFTSRHSDIFPRDANYNPPATWSAKPYVDEIEAGGPQIVENFNQNVAPLAGDLLQQVETFAQANNLQAAPWFKPMMDALQTGGLSKLKQLIQDGVVPVAVLGLVLPVIGSRPETAPGV